jgi:excisionase family DNA binding protein
MNLATRTAVSTLLAADPSVKPESIPVALNLLAGRKPLPADLASKQEFLTVAEACDLLRCSRTTLFREEQENRIQSVRLRGRKLFEREVLINALRREGVGKK